MTFAEAKKRNPKLRRTRPVGIIHSGGKRTIYDCCLCGEQHTAATRYRGQTKHEREFINFHNQAKCQAKG